MPSAEASYDGLKRLDKKEKDTFVGKCLSDIVLVYYGNPSKRGVDYLIQVIFNGHPLYLMNFKGFRIIEQEVYSFLSG
jgi:hypothetical protein